MTKNTINVTASTGAPVKVNVVATNSQGEVTLSQDTSAYNAEIARQWAISDHKVLQEDYSSKYYAGKAKESETATKNYATTVENVYSEIQNSANGVIADIEEARIDAVDNITTAKDESIASVEAKSNEVLSTVNAGIAEINTTKTNAVNAVNNTKTTILQDIEFVADGEKQEIQDLADEIKDNGNTVNTAINAGVERLNSIDALKKSQITNCITEIPQRIKLELNNGTVVLKAGSVITVPDGDTYKYVTTTKDLSNTNTSDGTFFICAVANGTSITIRNIQNCESGATRTLSKTYSLWYDTTNNVIHNYTTNATTASGTTAFPLGIVTISNGVMSSIDQVFNGFGYIGKTLWVDKGIKCLIPNGRNEDGTLKNIELTTTEIKLRNDATNATNKQFVLYQNKNLGLGNGFISCKSYADRNTSISYQYVEETNNTYVVARTYVEPLCVLADITCDGTKVVSLKPKQPFRAVDYNEAVIKSDLSEAQVVIETYVNGTSWYRIWSPDSTGKRWCEQGGIYDNGTFAREWHPTITLLKPYKSVDDYIVIGSKSKNDNNLLSGMITFGKGTNSQFTIQYYGFASNDTARRCDWYACGYIA